MKTEFFAVKEEFSSARGGSLMSLLNFFGFFEKIEI
jgi:hypothetical protein